MKTRTVKTRTVKLSGNMLTITQDGKATNYALTDIGSDDAQYGFRLEKLDDGSHVVEVYDCELYPPSGHHGCSCAGGTYRGTCRHLLALVALEKAGRLTCQRPVRKAV